MPVPTIQQLEKKEASLKQVVADQGDSTEAAKRRATKKKLRRAQRKRRRFATEQARQEKMKPKPKAAAQPVAGKAEESEAKTE
jgi:hypothetical protein